MTADQLTELINKYLSGEASQEEREKVERWYESFDEREVSFEKDEVQNAESIRRSLQAIREKIAGQQLSGEQRRLLKKKAERKVLYRWAAAAAVLFLVSGTAYFFLRRSPEEQTRTVQVENQSEEIQDIQPGKTKAILTLGNGKRVILDSTNKGLLSTQGGTRVIKLNNGLLAYNRDESSGSKTNRQDAISYNTITTPSGGKYEIVLPDGSKVWLNSASSIKFPTAFTGGKREVEVTGETFFEIAKDENKPFFVRKGEVAIQVLGTSFDVMAYEDDPNMKVTLVEGKIKVATDNKRREAGSRRSAIISPGEQVRITKEGEMSLTKGVNIAEEVAWKNGLFWFDEDGVQQVIKKLSRWYNVDITVEGSIPDKFNGSIPMDLPLSKVVGMLQKTGRIHYKIMEDGRVILSP